MRREAGQGGFTLIEVAVATLVLVVGLVSMLALFAQAVVVLAYAQEDLIAQQKGQEALESIFTARNTQQITFDKVQNTSAGGIFLDGWRPLQTSGPDGLVGTADDGPVETLTLPGPDGLLGTADDVIRSLTNFTRQIDITPLVIGGTASPDIRQVAITVRYSTPRGWQRSYKVVSYISRFR
jgi:type II secretory pathway pseudopilin PulG